MDDVVVQLRVVLVMAAGGLLLGLVFDVYRVLRGIGRPGRFGSAVGDLLFWCLATSIVAGAFVVSNRGEIRLGAVLAFGLGALIHFRLTSSIFVSILSAVLRATGSALGAGIGVCRASASNVKGCTALVGHRARMAGASLLRSLRKKA